MFGKMSGGVCLLVLVATMAWATTARRFSNHDLAVSADVVVIGECTNVRSAWVDRMLVTEATVRVTENLKGTGTQLTVILPGGIDANRPVPIMMSYAGAPQMRTGEEVFLFLDDETTSLGGYTIVGFSQGKFSIVNDAQGRKQVERDLTNVELQNGTGTSRGTHTLTRLEEFKEEIKAHLANR
jgi:hypothetical protein